MPSLANELEKLAGEAATFGTLASELKASSNLVNFILDNQSTILSALREREAVTDWLRGHSIAGDHLASRIEAGEHMKGEG